MPHDPQTIRQDVVEGTSLGGGHDVVVITEHESTAGPNGEVEFDVFKDFDLWRAKRVMSVLQSEYPGHLWGVVSDVKQGIVKISIPILMGVNFWYIINEKQTQVTKGAVVVAGGEILERYGLSRIRFNLGSFLEARSRHSALVMPSRHVPG